MSEKLEEEATRVARVGRGSRGKEREKRIGDEVKGFKVSIKLQQELRGEGGGEREENR